MRAAMAASSRLQGRGLWAIWLALVDLAFSPVRVPLVLPWWWLPGEQWLRMACPSFRLHVERIHNRHRLFPATRATWL